jgi:C4-dicarboxylate transporter DctM subunit
MVYDEIIGVLGTAFMLLLLALGVHIGVVFGITGFLGFVALLGPTKGLAMLVSTPYYVAASPAFVVLPLFILMGEFAFLGGLGRNLYEATTKWLGHVHGALAMSTAAASAMFGAVTGSTLATSAMFGKLAVPEMIRANYDRSLAASVVAASGTMAAMIPPSGLMVMYSIFTNESLGKLLIAGFIPGGLMAVLYMALIYSRVRLNPQLAPRLHVNVPLREKIASTVHLIPVIIVVLVMLVGLYSGVFSPSEAGAVGSFTILAIVLMRRSLPFKAIVLSLENTAETCGKVVFLIIGAMIFAKFISMSNLADVVVEQLSLLNVSRWLILFMILFSYLIMGCFLSVIAMMAITLPIYYPLLMGLGFDGVWFGIIMIQMCEIGAITPPIGLNVYVTKGVLGDMVTTEQLFRGIIPFFCVDIITLFVLLAFPQITLWLPSKMF